MGYILVEQGHEVQRTNGGGGAEERRRRGEGKGETGII